MKKISILVPCYNEEQNVSPMAKTLTAICQQMVDYDYEIIFRDNASTDGTVAILREIAQNDQHIKVILNCRNYGVYAAKDTFRGRVSGDVLISIPCDFQEPPELIPEFIKWYEKGYEIVAGQKTSSKEGKIKYGLRQIFYKVIDMFSDYPQIANMSGIVLMSRRIKEMTWRGNGYLPFRNFVSDLGCDIKLIQYEQQRRKSGKSSYNLWRYLSFSINSLVSTSNTPLRIATVMGVICSALSFVMGIIYLVCKLIWWNRFPAGTAPILIGVFLLGSIQLFFIGLIGEYVAHMLQMVSPATPALVKELINFDNIEDDPYIVKSVVDESKNSMINN